MKKFVRRVQDLSEKAAHFKAAAGRAPAQVRDLRETVLATAGEFQQLRGEVQSAVTGLRVDGVDQLTRALAELDGSREIFTEAGYDLAGVDIELSPVQRLIVHLEKFEDVSEAGLGLLLASIAARRTTHAVLAALIRAEQLAARVSLSELAYRELTVHVGPVPTVRLCWRPPEAEEEQAACTMESAAVAAPEEQPPPLPVPESGSFFAPRPVVSTPVPPVVPQPQPQPEAAPAGPAPVVAAQPAAPAPSPLSGDWKKSALDRFKKMPELARR